MRLPASAEARGLALTHGRLRAPGPKGLQQLRRLLHGERRGQLADRGAVDQLHIAALGHPDASDVFIANLGGGPLAAHDDAIGCQDNRPRSEDPRVNGKLDHERQQGQRPLQELAHAPSQPVVAKLTE